MGDAASFPLALVFGALISATDPVAVVALFRALGVPKRLALLVEGESLLNDGTAIVVFNLVLAAALTGRFNFVEGVGDFLRVAAGGTVVGLLLGWITAQLIARVDDYLIEITLTTVLAFGSYLVAERLHFSGVLAVVIAKATLAQPAFLGRHIEVYSFLAAVYWFISYAISYVGLLIEERLGVSPDKK